MSHPARIRHLHCKNVRAPVLEQALANDWSFLDAVSAGVFTVPGDAERMVDFEGVIGIATDAGYRGWLVLEAEQDPDKADPLVYGRMRAGALRALAQR